MRAPRVVLLGLLVSPIAAGSLAAQEPPAGPRISGYVQPRFTATGDSATFLLRRARLGAQGSITPWASYKVQVELRTGGTGATAATASATDLYVALNRGQWTGTIGQFKAPFGREFITSSTVLELPRRSRVSNALVPGRDIGVMVEWRLSQRVRAQGGAFNGRGINRGTSNGRRPLYVGRLLARAIPGLDLGADVASYADSNEWSLEAHWHRAAWSARGEYLRRNTLGAVRDHAAGWYAQAAYRAERYHMQGVGRVEQYEPSAALGGRGTAYTAGAQYFIRGDDFKLMASYSLYTGTAFVALHDGLTMQLQLRY